MNRSTRTLALALAVPALAALAACARSNGSGDNVGADDRTDSSTAATAAAPAPAAPVTDTAAGTPAGVQPGTVSDAQIAAIVLAANSADSASGELAREKAQNPKVKQFAQRMVTDHGGVNKQAVALAGKLHLTPEENNTSRQLTQGGQQTRQQLTELAPNAFDRGYIDHEVEYHETVLQAIDQTLIPNAQNAELKALLQQVRPAVAAHLQMAKDLQKELAGS
jgi:putative membrane protein